MRIRAIPRLHLALENVRIRNRGIELAFAEEAVVTVALLPLLQRELRFGAMTLDRVRISIERDREGRHNYEKPPGADAAFHAFTLQELNLPNLAVVYTDKLSDTRLEFWACSGELTDLRHPGDAPLSRAAVARREVRLRRGARNGHGPVGPQVVRTGDRRRLRHQAGHAAGEGRARVGQPAHGPLGRDSHPRPELLAREVSHRGVLQGAAARHVGGRADGLLDHPRDARSDARRVDQERQRKDVALRNATSPLPAWISTSHSRTTSPARTSTCST